MATTRTLTLQINGVTTQINNITQLQSEVQRLETAMNQAQFGSAQFAQLQREAAAARAALQQVQNATQGVSQGAQAAGGAAQQMGSDMENAFGLASLAGGQTGEVLELLQGGFQKAQGAIATFKVALGTVKGALIATGVGAFLVVLGLLITYLTKSQAGLDFMSRKAAGLGAVFTVLSDKAVALGKVIFDAIQDPQKAIDKLSAKVKEFQDTLVKAFTNPRKTITELVDFIEGNIINRMKAFGVILDAINSRNFKQLGNGIIQLGTGITNGVDKARKALNDLTADERAAFAAGDKLRGERIKLDRQAAAAELQKNQNRGEIERLKKDADDVTKTFAQRSAAVKQAAALEQKLFSDQIRIQAQIIDNLKQTQKLKKNITDEDKAEMAEELSKLAEFKEDSFGKQTELMMMEKGINDERTGNAKAAADKRLADQKEAEAKRKEQAEKALADLQAAQAIEFDIRKKGLDKELSQASQGSAEYLAIQKKQKALETEILLQGLNDKYAKAGELEKVALKKQIETTTQEGQDLQAKMDADFVRERAIKSIEGEKAISDAKLGGLQQGSEAYYDALLTQVNQQETIDLARIENTKENEALITAIKIKAQNERNAIELDRKFNKPTADFGADVLQGLFGFTDKESEKVKAQVTELADYSLGVTLNMLALVSEAKLVALDAEDKANTAQIDKAKEASDALKSELDESSSRVDDLESKLLNAKGVERQRILDQLSEERKRNKQIADDKKREDDRIKRAEQTRLEIEKKRTQEQEKQAKTQAVLNALSATAAAIQSSYAAFKAISTVAEIGSKGKFGIDNLVLIATATAAMAGAFVALKGAAKGFADGGYTGPGDKYEEAGVVHRGEYVIPKWMVESPQYQGTISGLESARQRGYAEGGLVTPAPQIVTLNAGADGAALLQLQTELVNLRTDFITLVQRPAEVSVQEFHKHNATMNEIKQVALK